MKVAPSIICADFRRLGEELKALEDAGADLLHIDIMDGMFVPNITFGPMVVETLRDDTDLLFDTHLMIVEPDRYIERFAISGANIITVHVEACNHLHRTVDIIRSFDVIPGVALSPATPLSAIEYVLDSLEMVTIMGVNPGFPGQTFIPAVVRKVEQLRKLVDENGLDITIQVDGGMRDDVAPVVRRAGADIVVAGASVFIPGTSYRENIRKLRDGELMGVA